MYVFSSVHLLSSLKSNLSIEIRDYSLQSLITRAMFKIYEMTEDGKDSKKVGEGVKKDVGTPAAINLSKWCA